MNTSDDYGIKKILFNKYNALGRLCFKSQKITSLDTLLKSSLDSLCPNISQYCKIAGMKDNYLTIETSRSEFVTQLRFISQDLLSSLRQNPELYKLINIKFKVNPELVNNNYSIEKKHKKNSQQVKTSESNRSNTDNSNKKPNQSAKTRLQELSKNIKDLKLKAALLKLIK